jgi:hypothetical protein
MSAQKPLPPKIPQRPLEHHIQQLKASIGSNPTPIGNQITIVAPEENKGLELKSISDSNQNSNPNPGPTQNQNQTQTLDPKQSETKGNNSSECGEVCIAGTAVCCAGCLECTGAICTCVGSLVADACVCACGCVACICSPCIACLLWCFDSCDSSNTQENNNRNVQRPSRQ